MYNGLCLCLFFMVPDIMKYVNLNISYSSVIIVGYPSEKAALVALKTVRDFLEKDDTYKKVSLRYIINA